MKNDEKLDEVRAILRRLQHIDTGEEKDAAPAALEGAAPVKDRPAPVHAAPEASARKPAPAPAAVAPRQRASPRLVGAVAAGVAMLLVAGIGFALWLGSPGEPPTLRTAQQAEIRLSSGAERERTIAAISPPTEQRTPDAPPPASTGAIQPAATQADSIAEAQRLIGEGKVTAARELLLGGPAGESAEAALALARSYDPNSLRLIANADAGPDVDEAERWYRRWSELAASEGLALDGFRLERIIKAMR